MGRTSWPNRVWIRSPPLFLAYLRSVCICNRIAEVKSDVKIDRIRSFQMCGSDMGNIRLQTVAAWQWQRCNNIVSYEIYVPGFAGQVTAFGAFFLLHGVY